MDETDPRTAAVCHFGGVFEISVDGSMSYKGGDTHVVDITSKTNLDTLKTEISEILNCTSQIISIKYFLPGFRKTLITISNNEDFRLMLEFHGNSSFIDVYIILDESNVATSGATNDFTSRTMPLELSTPADDPLIDNTDDQINMNMEMNNATQNEDSMITMQHEINGEGIYGEITTFMEDVFFDEMDTMGDIDLDDIMRILYSPAADIDEGDEFVDITGDGFEIPSLLNFTDEESEFVDITSAKDPPSNNLDAEISIDMDMNNSTIQIEDSVTTMEQHIDNNGDLHDEIFNMMEDVTFDESADITEDIVLPDETIHIMEDNHVEAIDKEDEFVDIPRDRVEIPSFPDISVPCVQTCSENVRYWQKAIIGVGQRFKDIPEFRESVRKYAIAHRFAIRFMKSENNRVTVKCKVEGCPWRIHASKVSNTPLISIKTMNSAHTCDGFALPTGYQATKRWVASIIKETLKAKAEYTPNEIMNDIKEEYGIDISYFQAYRGKEMAQQQLDEALADACRKLPIFREKILEANPGSHVALAFNGGNRFQGIFVSFRASLVGFQLGCRPLIFLDNVSAIKSRYQKTLLSAMAVDGDDKEFPVAFAIVNEETSDTWYWFLCHLNYALAGASSPITFVADMEKELKKYISEIFPDGHHAYCLRYFKQNLFREISIPIEAQRVSISQELYRAACALKAEEFYECLENIKTISVEAYSWLLKSDLSKWAIFVFLGKRYNHMNSNFGEDFYSCISVAPPDELPIIHMCESIRGKITNLFITRWNKAFEWTSMLTLSKEEKLHRVLQSLPNALVSNISGSKFQVQVNNHNNSIVEDLVDLERRSCTCQEWHFTAMPCRHALSAIRFIGTNIYEYCSRYFSTENYRVTYAGEVIPTPSIPRPDNLSEAPAQVGENAKKSRPNDPFKREIRCSKCQKIGHNKRSCKA